MSQWGYHSFPMEDVALDYHDSLLLKSDVSLLENGNWLNDKIIGFCFEYFEHERFSQHVNHLSFISPVVSQLIIYGAGFGLSESLSGLDLPSKQYVFLAVNNNDDTEQVGGTHWSLLVYVRSKDEFHHYDSMHQMNSNVAKQLVQGLCPLVQASPESSKLINMDTPQQQNGHDCGMYVISIAEHLCREVVEGYSVNLIESMSHSFIQSKRQMTIDLITKLSQESNCAAR